MRTTCIRKIGVSVLVGMLIFSGCSLAVEDAGEENVKSQDRLIGAFITNEHLDLFDMEAYLNDHADGFIGGEDSNEGIVDGRKYNERLYAIVDKNDSSSPMDWEITFGDVEGICFFDAKFQNEGEEPFTMIVGDDEICDVHSSMSVSDAGESVALTGTIYALAEKGELHFFVNPVYQTEDGEIYAVTGNGYHMSSELGGSTKVNLDETVTSTEDDIEQNYGSAVEIAFEVVKYAPMSIRMQYMNEDLEIVETKEYAAEEMPEQLEMAETAVCVIVETLWADGSVTRELYEPEEDGSISMETFYKVSDTALGKRTTEIAIEVIDL